MPIALKHLPSPCEPEGRGLDLPLSALDGGGRGGAKLRRVALAQSFPQVITHPQRIGHDGQGRIHCAAGRKEAGVNDIEIVHVVCLTAGVESRSLGIDPKADGAVLMGHPGQWDALADEQIPREQSDMAFMPVDRTFRLLLHQSLEFGNETSVSLLVVRCVAEDDVAVAVECDPIVGIG